MKIGDPRDIVLVDGPHDGVKLDAMHTDAIRFLAGEYRATEETEDGRVIFRWEKNE